MTPCFGSPNLESAPFLNKNLERHFVAIYLSFLTVPCEKTAYLFLYAWMCKVKANNIFVCVIHVLYHRFFSYKGQYFHNDGPLNFFSRPSHEWRLGVHEENVSLTRTRQHVIINLVILLGSRKSDHMLMSNKISQEIWWSYYPSDMNTNTSSDKISVAMTMKHGQCPSVGWTNKQVQHSEVCHPKELVIRWFHQVRMDHFHPAKIHCHD